MNTTDRWNRDVRVRRPERLQKEWREFCFEELLPVDHQARLVWAYVESLDLEPLYQQINVTRNTAGRSAIAPEILVALWLLATLE